MLTQSQTATRALRLSDIGDEPVGGKASGLAWLTGIGLQVPDAFVIINASSGSAPADVMDFYTAIGGGKVAVRSSAIGEDGEEASFAGQYETLLNIEGKAALLQAIDDCVASLHNERASAYLLEQADLSETTMCVVVQKMVDAHTAGVLFSADPVTGRHDRLVIDAVAGLGEALVSGDVTPDHYELNPRNEITAQEWIGDTAILTPAQINELSTQAREAVTKHGEHLDMEWAYDAEGNLHWLQARPITTLGCDLNHDYTPIPSDHVITRCNVGEMMPGPVCQLTYDTQGRAIEHGMQHMHVCYAGRPKITDEWTQINRFYGHMFINMSGGLQAARYVSLTSAETMGQTMCGRLIPELTDPTDQRSLPRRWWGSIQFVRYCLAARRVISEFMQRFATFKVALHDHSRAMNQEMEKQFRWLLEADEVHLRSSAYSGLMEGVIQGIVSGAVKDPTPEQEAELQAQAARLLAGAENVESAVMVQQLDAVVDLIAKDRDHAVHFKQLSANEALAELQREPLTEAGLAFAAFLQRHGHRGYRELCVREKAWREQPEQVITTMQASLSSRLTGTYTPRSVESVDLAELNRALRFLLPRAHQAIRQREETKSMLVEATYRLKIGYRHLGQLLHDEGALTDPDLIYFMSRDELTDFCEHPDTSKQHRAEQRRRALEFQQKLEFEDVHIGFAKPTEYQPPTDASENELVGRPVSRGVVEGLARVAVTLEEAALLEPGEILVSHITDIGWTPYFSLIGGLATDVGSAVSHGAVIAREYGLPAIVNLRRATRVVNTGDRIRLDADRGILEILDSKA